MELDKKGWALFIQRWVLTQRESSAPDCREDGLGKDLYYLPTGIRTLSLWRGLPCDLGQKGYNLFFHNRIRILPQVLAPKMGFWLPSLPMSCSESMPFPLEQGEAGEGES